MCRSGSRSQRKMGGTAKNCSVCQTARPAPIAASLAHYGKAALNFGTEHLNTEHATKQQKREE